MNLATRDIRHNAARFALTTAGIGLLLMLVMGMSGIYRGLVIEALLLVDKVGADLWIVQGSTRGPLAEISRVPASLEDRARAVPGVASARRFVFHTIQREHRGRPLRIVVQGLAWPDVSREILKKPTGNVTLFAFDEGEGLSEHTAPFDALVQVIEGLAEITISGQAHRVQGGEIILMPAGQPHALKAPQRFKMILTMIRS